MPDAATSPFLSDQRFISDDGYFRWGVQVDDMGLEQMRRLYAGGLASAPKLTWWANVVTDAGHHAGGPRSEPARESLRQADARLGVFLDLLDARGELDDVAVLLTADHGFEVGPRLHGVVAAGVGRGWGRLPRRGARVRLPSVDAWVGFVAMQRSSGEFRPVAGRCVETVGGGRCDRWTRPRSGPVRCLFGRTAQWGIDRHVGCRNRHP